MNSYFKVQTKPLSTKTQDYTYEALLQPTGGVGYQVPDPDTEWYLSTSEDPERFIRTLRSVAQGDIILVQPIDESEVPADALAVIKPKAK